VGLQSSLLDAMVVNPGDDLNPIIYPPSQEIENYINSTGETTHLLEVGRRIGEFVFRSTGIFVPYEEAFAYVELHGAWNESP
jgi:hypothetical protein